MSNKDYKTSQKMFRVWNGKEMCYRGSIQFDFVDLMLKKETFFEFEGIESGEIVVGDGTTKFEIMQWIGKYDRHGKRIFESDILKFKDPSYWEQTAYGQVVYNHDNCQFEVRNLKRNTYYDKSFSYEDHEFCRMHDIEVIGNIHQNPNMLIEYDDIPKNVKK
jgi:uncharacterized phage protein (TIGR01671 family)